MRVSFLYMISMWLCKKKIQNLEEEEKLMDKILESRIQKLANLVFEDTSDIFALHPLAKYSINRLYSYPSGRDVAAIYGNLIMLHEKAECCSFQTKARWFINVAMPWVVWKCTSLFLSGRWYGFIAWRWFLQSSKRKNMISMNFCKNLISANKKDLKNNLTTWLTRCGFSGPYHSVASALTCIQCHVAIKSSILDVPVKNWSLERSSG